MSIQNRLLLIYTGIFSLTFFIVAWIVYTFPANRLLEEMGDSLEAVAVRTLSGDFQTISVANASEDFFLPPRNSLPLETNVDTAATLVQLIDSSGVVVGQTTNFTKLEHQQLYLDPTSFRRQMTRHIVQREGQPPLLVVTVPMSEDGQLLIRGDESQRPISVYAQTARVLDSYNSFRSSIALALLMGGFTAVLSLIIAIAITPSLFRPLEDIAAATLQITNTDDLSYRVPVDNRADEIGKLGRAINQALERLERLFRSQQRLMADVSHELRTPLTSIRGNIDLMQQMGEYDEESVEIIQDEVKRMTRLVGDLLMLARADTGGMPLAWEPIELDSLLFEVYRKMNKLPHDITLTIQEVDQVTVMADSDRLRQVLINLIDNAMKYTPANGRVTLALSKSDKWAQIEVADTGVGIPEEDLTRIFDRFYRVDKARSRAMGGSGLGLSIVDWIVRSYGGEISVASVVGEGTTFTVKLPVVNQDALAEELAKPPEPRRTLPRLRLPGR